MLSTFLEKGIFSFQDHFTTWEDAVRASYVPMKEKGIVEDNYVDLVVDCVKKYGPYIVIAPNIAMPHSTEGAQGVHDTAIGFMKVNQPVHFDPDDPEKDARLFFSLAATDHEQHLENMMKLSEMLMDDDLVNDLLQATCEEDLRKLAKKYNL